MATSGSKTVTVTNWDKLTFSWSVASQSVANNTSTISWSLRLVSTSDGRIDSSASKTWKVNVAGSSYSGTNTVGISNNSSKTLASGTTVVKHNADGTKSFDYSFSQEFGITFSGKEIGTISGSGSGTLNTIPRKSVPTLSASTVEIGKTLTIYTNRASDSFTHKLYYGWYGTEYVLITTGVGASYTWTVPLAFANSIPNATSGWGGIRCETYSGSTLIGTADVTFTGTVPASMKPSCSLTVSDPTGNQTTYGSYVKGLSKFQVSIGTTISYGSAIKSYNSTANGGKYTAASFTTDVLKSSGTLSIATTVTDKRGRTGTASKSISVLNYVAPSISKLVVTRCNADGTTNRAGEYAKATFSATVTSLNSKNAATYTLRYKKTSNTSWTEEVLSGYANNYAVTNGTAIFAAATGNSYDVELVLTDNHSTTTRSTSAPTAFILQHYGPNGTSVAFGKRAEKSESVEFGLKMYDRFGMSIGNGLAAYGASGNAIDADTTIENHFLTTVGTPTTEFWHVQQFFYSSKTNTSNRIQIAYPYNRAGSTFKRFYINGDGWSAWESEALQAYPVGSIYIAYNHTNPGTLFGGTWTRITEAFLWATSSGGTIGATGGEKNHTLTTSELPSHTHVVTVASTASGSTAASNTIRYNNDSTNTLSDKLTTKSTGGGEAHNNMPPYIQVSVWRRTA